ncbi:lactonase family protein [Mesorhizobium sp. dw_380]|uniref:lactonase family protein n=1 Tax=Mesorhizobium sp. dw_380 TaxID=2812001 RepID=UPI001BDF65EE|nr:lactonase family protein [Mesorhizobium sp. dw_380]
MIPRIDFKASEAVRAALSGIGRTEDLRFSPDNRLLAIAGYARKRCLILRIDVAAGPDGPNVTIHDFMELRSDNMGEVHGLDFIDDRTLAIANRDGLVAIFTLPHEEPAGQSRQIAAIRRVRGRRPCKLNSPGSIAVRLESRGRVSLLVCNNYTHLVTRHVVNRWLGYRATSNQRLLERGLDIPDGIALSHDGRWIAVSSHGTKDVKLYRMSASLGPDTEPVGVLQHAGYPHGVRFAADDRHMLVADAGSQMVHVYDSDGDWSGDRAPARSIAVLDEGTFLRGRASPEEGGPKGLDIDRSSSVVAVTCEEQTLAFYPLASFLGRTRLGIEPSPPQAEAARSS